MFFTFIGTQYGGPLENTLLEIVSCGTVPVIRKELYDSANYYGDRLDYHRPEDIGTVVYDSENPYECLALMNKLNDDNILYNEYREKAFAYYSSIFHRPIIMKKLFDTCIGD